MYGFSDEGQSLKYKQVIAYNYTNIHMYVWGHRLHICIHAHLCTHVSKCVIMCACSHCLAVTTSHAMYRFKL